MGKKDRKKHSIRPKADWLIVGLGNPGPEYENTRHNIGWTVAKQFAYHHQCINFKKKNLWYECQFQLKNQRIAVILPTVYMNNSGKAVAQALQEFLVPVSRLIVISDEYNFPVGRIHLRRGGGPGGHNGLRSIVESLGTTDFWRLRCGIGRNFGPGGMANYVLSPFSPDEEHQKNQMIEDAIDTLDMVIILGPERAMTEMNARSKEKFGDLRKSD